MSSGLPFPMGFTHNVESFRGKMPYQLLPTNLKGAYSTPAPPESFNPNSASPSDLMKHGLMWRKPTPSDPPELRAAWEKFFSRKWLAKDRIIPESHPQLGITHNYRGAAPKLQKD